MCLRLPNTFKTREKARAVKPKIAKEDIFVYKKLIFDTVKKVWHSPVYGMTYLCDMTYTTEMRKRIESLFYGSMHDWIVNIENGFHFYVKKPFGRATMRMIIPKGSKYFISADGLQIVSNRVKTPKRFRPTYRG